MEKKNIDWSNIGFGYMKTDKRYVSNFKDGKWDEGTLTEDDTITMSECACVLQYAQTCFEGMKAYTTEQGKNRCISPGLKCIPYGRFCKAFGDAGLPGRPFC